MQCLLCVMHINCCVCGMTKAQNETASRASCKEQLHPERVMVKHGKEAVNGTALGCLDLVKMYGEKNKRTLM